jgi:hypothetical protein
MTIIAASAAANQNHRERSASGSFHFAGRPQLK